MAGGGVKPGLEMERPTTTATTQSNIKFIFTTCMRRSFHLLGLDRSKLTYQYAGRDFGLTDVHGHVVNDVLI